MRVLVGCEHTGVVRDAFAAMGHYAVSCDLLPDQSGTKGALHYQGNVFDIIEDNWDLGIFHPPCTYLASSGMHWTTRGLRDPKLTEDALAFVSELMNAPIPRICIENPVGVISTRLRKPDQIIQPWQFGEDASKRTCLWLKHLPKLQETAIVQPRMVNGKPRWANQTDSGQNRLAPSEDRWQLRSATYPGIAKAMASQWSDLI